MQGENIVREFDDDNISQQSFSRTVSDVPSTLPPLPPQRSRAPSIQDVGRFSPSPSVYPTVHPSEPFAPPRSTSEPSPHPLPNVDSVAVPVDSVAMAPPLSVAYKTSSASSPFSSSSEVTRGSSYPTIDSSIRPCDGDNNSDDDSDGADCDEKYCPPQVRIHRHDVGTRTLHCLVLAWLLSGFAFLTVVTLCITVNVGYVSFRSTGMALPVVCAFTFATFFLFRVYRSLARTFLRMGMQVCREKFGGGESEKDWYPLRWIDSLSDYLARKITGNHVHDTISSSECRRQEVWAEYIKAFVLALVLSAAVGVPLILVALYFGYWAVINVLCVFLTIGSAGTILVVNVGARLVRFVKFLWRMGTQYKDARVPARLRAAYLATTGHDQQRNLIDSLCERGLGMAALVLVCGSIFTNFNLSFGILITVCCTVVLCLLIRVRRFLCCCYQTRLRTFQSQLSSNSLRSNNEGSNGSQAFLRSMNNLEVGEYYRGKAWEHVVVIFIVRFIAYFLGLASLVYMDLSSVESLDGASPNSTSLYSRSGTTLALWTLLFFGAIMLRDVFFITPLCMNKIRPLLIGLAQISMFLVAGFGRAWFSGFTFGACLFLAVYELNYREGRYYWSGRRPKTVLSRQQRRAMRNAFMILGALGIFIGVAVLLGMIVGSLSDTLPNVRISPREPSPNEIFQGLKDRLDNEASEGDSFTPPICSMRFTRNGLSVIDLATMSDAAYEPNRTAAEKYIRQNKYLDDWRLESYNFDNTNYNFKKDNPEAQPDPEIVRNVNMTSGARFVEFVHNKSNISVIAVRGTHSLEDIFQDLYLWSTPAFLQMSSYFGTLVTLWPIRTVAYTVYIITNLFSYPNLMYWGEMQAVVENIINGKRESTSLLNRFLRLFGRNSISVSNTPVLLTGHSLGGGLASIVASHLSLPAVVFSSPGLGYSTYNYNVTEEAVMTHTMNVIPLGDPVPGFDKQIGMIQNLPCDAGQPMECHSLTRTLRMLVEICGASN